MDANRTLVSGGIAFLACLLASAVPADAGGGRAADHVVLISFDGLRPEFYLDPRWPAPMLQQMRREGAHAAAVDSVFPSVTYPAHATMITGVLPTEHGIDYNSPFELAGATGRWYWEAEHIRAPTLWDAARAAGLTTASVFWPVSVGAPIDRNVPEIWPLAPKQEFVAPLRRLATPPGLVEELEREATGRLSPHTFSFGRLSLDDRTAAMAAYLLAAYRPNLLTVHLIGADHFQHEEGRDGPTVPRAVAALDRGVARIVEAAERAGILERTAFLLVGDHGFVDLHTEVAPNVWLAEDGLMEARSDRGDWRATVHTASAAGFLHLARAGDVASEARARAVLESQPAEVRALYRIVERAELDRLGSAPRAAFAIAPAPGVSISSRHEPPAVRPRRGASHGGLPDQPQLASGLVAWGAGIRPRGRVERLTLLQIAPLVSELLGLELAGARAPVPAELLTQSGTAPP